ncbi:MAG: sugar transporter permease [Proteobacteria bacterium]|nr:sugar transporter permease [Pseudomonadota bacterium]
MKKMIVPLLLSALLTVPVTVLAKESTWISDKPLTLKIHLHARDKYVWDENLPMSKELFRLTNLQLIGTANKTATNSQEQFNLMMATGNLPDIVAGDSLKDNFIRYGMEGAFQPLNKLIDQHAPNLKAFFKSHPEVQRAITAPDGNIYFIPYVPDGKVSRGWWIRKDWLDKLGLKEPQNIHELYTVLKAFREKDPNGNGKKDEIPFFDKEPERLYNLVNFWGCRSTGSDAAMDFFVDANGKVRHPFAEPCFKEGIRNLAKWYAEGLIDPEIYTRKNRAREQLFGANQGGMTFDWFASTAGFNDSISKTVRGFKLIPLAPPADINGKRWLENSRAEMRPDGWAMTVTNKNPVETIKLFDFFFSRTGRNLQNFGVEGYSYDMKNGKAVFKDAVLKSSKPVNNQLWEMGALLPIGYWMDYEYERQWTNPAALQGIEMYAKGNWFVPLFYGVNMKKEERAVYDQFWPDIQTYMAEMAQNWVLGTKNVDKTWDEYQARLKSSGFHAVLNAMQAAYDRQYGKR